MTESTTKMLTHKQISQKQQKSQINKKYEYWAGISLDQTQIIDQMYYDFRFFSIDNGANLTEASLHCFTTVS